MITINLSEGTGSTIYDWRPELASITAMTRLPHAANSCLPCAMRSART